MPTLAARSPGLATPVRALTLGLVTGLRQQLPVALPAVAASRARLDPGSARLARQLGSPGEDVKLRSRPARP